MTWKEINTRLGVACPNFLKLVDLALTIPASSADAERGFSCLKLTKTDLRNRLGDCHLSDQMSIILESESISNFDPMPSIHLWYASRSRRPRQIDNKKCERMVKVHVVGKGGELDRVEQVEGGELDRVEQVEGGELDRVEQVEGGELDRVEQVEGGELDRVEQVEGGELDEIAGKDGSICVTLTENVGCQTVVDENENVKECVPIVRIDACIGDANVNVKDSFTQTGRGYGRVDDGQDMDDQDWQEDYESDDDYLDEHYDEFEKREGYDDRVVKAKELYNDFCSFMLHEGGRGSE